MSCRTAHCAWRGRSHAFLTCLGEIDGIGPAVGRDCLSPTNGRTEENHPFTTGIRATKWPRESGSPQTGLRLRGGKRSGPVRQDIFFFVLSEETARLN